ncbi:MAG: hypothetical protein SVU88_03265 [Candidatus Nanohaloarchaea archaeon]|nr:hypothetical protein [Candidatus Nanohaloarchaea archaeon]
MDAVRRAALAAGLLLGTVAVGVAAGGVPELGAGGGAIRNYTVTELLEDRPLQQRVRVTGNVSRVLEDYTADSGNVYQQFYIDDGTGTVKVFCGTGGGRVNLSAGDRVRVAGRFQKYYGEYEVYTACHRVRHNQ